MKKDNIKGEWRWKIWEGSSNSTRKENGDSKKTRKREWKEKKKNERSNSLMTLQENNTSKTYKLGREPNNELKETRITIIHNPITLSLNHKISIISSKAGQPQVKMFDRAQDKERQTILISITGIKFRSKENQLRKNCKMLIWTLTSVERRFRNGRNQGSLKRIRMFSRREQAFLKLLSN